MGVAGVGMGGVRVDWEALPWVRPKDPNHEVDEGTGSFDASSITGDEGTGETLTVEGTIVLLESDFCNPWLVGVETPSNSKTRDVSCGG